MSGLSGCIYTVVGSSKGGVGKTVNAANLGGMLVDLEQRVLFLDFDIQGSLTSYYDIERKSSKGLLEFFTAGNVEDVISRTSIGCDIISSNDPNGTLPNYILHSPDGRTRLRVLLEKVAHRYDHIIIDCQGAMGPLQDAALLAGDILLSPIVPDTISAKEWGRGTLRMVERLLPMERQLGRPMCRIFGLINGLNNTVDARETANVIRQFAEQIKGPLSGKVDILKTTIPHRVAYREARTFGMPIHRYEKVYRGKSKSGLESMLDLVRELPYGFESVTKENLVDVSRAGVTQ